MVKKTTFFRKVDCLLKCRIFYSTVFDIKHFGIHAIIFMHPSDFLLDQMFIFKMVTYLYR